MASSPELLRVPQKRQVPARLWRPLEGPSPDGNPSQTDSRHRNSARPFRVRRSTRRSSQKSFARPQPSWMSIRIALSSSLHIYIQWKVSVFLRILVKDNNTRNNLVNQRIIQYSQSQTSIDIELCNHWNIILLDFTFKRNKWHKQLDMQIPHSSERFQIHSIENYDCLFPK